MGMGIVIGMFLGPASERVCNADRPGHLLVKYHTNNFLLKYTWP